MLPIVTLFIDLLQKPKFSGAAVIGTAMLAALMCCRLADPVMTAIQNFLT